MNAITTPSRARLGGEMAPSYGSASMAEVGSSICPPGGLTLTESLTGGLGQAAPVPRTLPRVRGSTSCPLGNSITKYAGKLNDDVRRGRQS